jgi:lipoprotein-releasing system permease protein
LFSLVVARRYLLSNPWQTLLLVAGVATGVTVFVFITALIAGLAERLTDQVTGDNAHISLQQPTRVARVLRGEETVEAVALVSTLQRKQIRNWSDVLRLTSTIQGVSAVSPQISGNAFLVKAEAVVSVSVVGVEPDRLDAITRIGTRVVRGSSRLTANGVLIGARLAEDLGLDTGQAILLRTERDVDRQLVVTGVFQTGLQSLDERVAFVPLQSARSLFALQEGVTNIEIKLEDPARARDTAALLGQATGLRATPWQEKNESLEDALDAQGRTGSMIQAFALISIIIGIASALVLSAYRRRSEVGIMRAFGISRRFIIWVFMLQGVLIGLTGALAGCAAGYALCRMLETIRGSDGLSVLPIATEQGGYFAVVILTTLGAAVASVLPARSAARVDPLEAIQQ